MKYKIYYVNSEGKQAVFWCSNWSSSDPLPETFTLCKNVKEKIEITQYYPTFLEIPPYFREYTSLRIKNKYITKICEIAEQETWMTRTKEMAYIKEKVSSFWEKIWQR